MMRDECGLLRDYWYAAGLASDFAAKPVARTILEERLVLWRGRDGVVALKDRCLHRNAPLSEGEVVAEGVKCPYHGWTYAADGRCVAIPARPHDRPPADVRVEAFPTREQDGLVWVWMGRGLPDKDPFPMPKWATPGWKAYYMVTPFENGVTQLVENFMDVPHTIFVHKGWFRSAKAQKVRTVVERTADSVLVTYDQPRDQIGFTSRILNPGDQPMVHTDRFYMPNVTRVDYDFGGRTGFVITSTCTPETPFRTRVYTLISYTLGSRVLNQLARPFLPFYTRQVIRQDVDIMRVQGEVLRHDAAPAFHHSDADLHHLYIESLRDWAAGGGKDPRPKPVVREIEFWI